MSKQQRSRDYKKQISDALASPKLQQALHTFGDAYVIARENAFAGLDFEALRTEIAEMKDDVRVRNAELVEEFTRNAEAGGATVFFAKGDKEANDYIAQLAKERGVKTVAKSKSMVSEETHLNDALAKVGVKAAETDLGEWIIQLAGQRPSHMVMPAIHMFKEEVAELFGKETGKKESTDIEHLVEVARNQLRKVYFDAEMGITGGNIAVAETGGIALVTNEGNARLASTLPKIHVALVGTEKLVPKLEDAAKIIRVLPKNATGQLLTSYATWIQGAVPCDGEEKELHIVLIDNGRSKLAASPECRDALRCIRCGACANVCPVYQTVGGHVFGHIYISAIGVILTAFIHGMDKASELVKACIGCRACTAVCPSKIDLESIILHLRSVVGDKEGIGAAKSVVFKGVMRNRRLFHTMIRAASMLQKPVSKGEKTIRHLPLHFSSFTEWRTLPTIAEKPLRDLIPKMKQNVKKSRYKVALFGGCAGDFIYPEMGVSLVKVFNKLGVEVYFPEKQNCCGIPALYSGDKETAKEMATQNIKAMLEDNPDYIVTPCPTCTLALKRDFLELVHDDPHLAAQAKNLSAITYDASAFITNVLKGGKEFEGMADKEKITYHDSCHLRRGGNVWKEPRELLTTAGKELEEMAHPDRCCGFGGSYSFASHPNISREITKDKINDIEATGATTVAVDCPGCLIMLRGALEKRGCNVRATHTMELLAEAIENK